jgi:methyl-accepting chemotaxis protein
VTTINKPASRVKITIRKKLFLSFGVIIILVLIMGVLSMYLQMDSRNITSNVLDYETRLHTIQSLDYAARSADDVGAYYVMTGGNPTEYAQYQNYTKNTESLYATLLASTPVSDIANQTRLQHFHQGWVQYIQGNNQAFSLLANGKKTAAETLYAQAPFSPVMAPLTGYTQYLQTDEQRLITELDANQAKSYTINIIALILVILISIAVAVLLSRQITRAVTQVQMAMRKLAAKDLRIDPLPHTTNDELGELATNVNETITELQNVMRQIRRSAEEVSMVSEETAASTEETANALTEVANQIQQLNEEAQTGQEASVHVSQTLLELSSLIQLAQDKATSATTQAEVTQKAAESGMHTVEVTIRSIQEIQTTSQATEEKMNELQKYSKEIGAIAQTIREIAEQTNLLALNASIEAARAGEQGKGFAVVADEVRKLAEQTHQESGRVNEVLTRVGQVIDSSVEVTHNSLQTIQEGASQATLAGAALTSIDQAVQSTAGDIKGIYQVTKEEVANSERIVALIHEVATVIENTASHAQNVATSTEEMNAAMETIATAGQTASGQAVQLTEMVAQFLLP